MEDCNVTESIINLGASDNDLELFEGQYILNNGMSYNSYLIKDDKNVLMDTIDERVSERWLDNLVKALNGEKLDYLVVSHMEPDHAYNIDVLASKYPDMKIVGNQFTFNILKNFFDIDKLEERKIVVTDGEILDIGNHKLQFFMAPMVHWPEVMVTYEQTEKILFSADAFGKFGSLDVEDDWITEARRYYIGIVGKFGMQVQALLNKASTLDIKIICPLHGPVLKENLQYYFDKYATWSAYKPEEEGVYIACASIYGNSLRAAKKLEEMLTEKGINVVLEDLTITDWSYAIANAFKYSKMVLVASSYNAGVYPPMRNFLGHLVERNFQNRKITIIENGSWAPSAARTIKNIIEPMKNIEIIEPIITIKSTLKDENIVEMGKLVDELSKQKSNC